MSETNWFEEPKVIVMLIAFLLAMMFGIYGAILGLVITQVAYAIVRDAGIIMYGLSGTFIGYLMKEVVSLIFLGTL